MQNEQHTNNDEHIIPVIVYRLDATAKILEDMNKVLGKQTENLSQVILQQEKHNLLQDKVEDLEKKVNEQNIEIVKLNGFSHKINTGIYVSVFFFSILQVIFGWYFNEFNSKMEKIDNSLNSISKTVYILESNSNNSQKDIELQILKKMQK